MRSRYRKILIVAGAAMASMALIASSAQAATPAPPYEDFAGCPSEAEFPFVANCVKYTFTGGKIGFGNREVSVTKPIIYRGGSEQETGNFLNNGEGGIVPVQQTVPGGLVGLTGYKWLDEALGSSSLLNLYATVELAGEPGVIVGGPVRVIPVKLHLENAFLGSSCYIGSTANPITLTLTTGTTEPPAPNEPITGNPLGPAEPEAERPEVITATGGKYVDNAYSVPAASGCQFNFGPIHRSIDELVNSQYDLPSPAGTNTTELNFNRSVTFQSVVYP